MSDDQFDERWRQRGRTIPARDAGRGVGYSVAVEYVSRVPRPPLDGLIDDLYYLEGAAPYARPRVPGVQQAHADRAVEVRLQFLREHPGHVMDGWPLPAD